MSKGFPEQLMYKNHLQEYAQKSRLLLPIYCVKNEGFNHAPKFRASVSIDGKFYESKLTFSTRKEAEQNVAKLALDSLEVKTKDEGCAPIYKDLKRCKSILHEISVKMNWEHPKYTTIRKDDKHPVFVSLLLFDGITYTSGESRSIKEAEQMAASFAVKTLLGSGSGLVRQIINSKAQTFEAFPKLNDSGLSPRNFAMVVHQPVGPSGQRQNFTVSYPLPRVSKQGDNDESATPAMKPLAPVNSKRKLEMGTRGKKKLRIEKQ